MKVEGNRPVRSGAPASKAKRSDGSAFADTLRTGEDEGEISDAQGVSGTTPLSGIEALFSLQEVPDALAERKRGAARGEQMLERLENLRIGLLMGQIGPDKLAELAHLAREGSSKIDDPKLRDLLQEIELRAEVELAKLSR